MSDDNNLPPSPEKLQAQTIHAELTAVIAQHPGGWADLEALRTVQQLCFRFPHPGWGYMAEKVGQVESWAAILYTERKHQRHGPYGAGEVRGWIIGALNTLANIIRRMA